jgi:hypothetical protein
LHNQPFPAWARPGFQSPAAQGGAEVDRGDRDLTADAFFSAGAGLALLDTILRESRPFSGALRQRLALRAATASAAILPLREDSSALRDAVHLSAAKADPGPAGRLHRLWSRLATEPAQVGSEGFEKATGLLGLPEARAIGALVSALQNLAKEPRNSLAAAALTASLVPQILPEASRPDAEILALWSADLVLAARLGWERPVPLLATKILDVSLRRGEHGRGPRPGDPHWPEATARAYALAACDAHALALDLTRCSDKLLAALPKLRAKGARRVVDMLLDDDAVTAARAARSAGLSDRAARRLFDRLIALGAVREFSGRANFRLYGL